MSYGLNIHSRAEYKEYWKDRGDAMIEIELDSIDLEIHDLEEKKCVLIQKSRILKNIMKESEL